MICKICGAEIPKPAKQQLGTEIPTCGDYECQKAKARIYMVAYRQKKKAERALRPPKESTKPRKPRERKCAPAKPLSVNQSPVTTYKITDMEAFLKGEKPYDGLEFVKTETPGFPRVEFTTSVGG